MILIPLHLPISNQVRERRLGDLSYVHDLTR